MIDPITLGFPECFQSFRPVQEDCLEHVLTSDRRFSAIGAPPGCGKSAIAFALAKLIGGRTFILTSTLGLQDQYMKAFGAHGLVDVRGRSNFRCWEGGTCEDGSRLDCRDKDGCPYLQQLRVSRQSDCVISSYAFWLSSPAVVLPDTLILDEAGLGPEWLSRALDFTITERQCHDAKLKLSPIPGEELDEWTKLAPALSNAADALYTRLKCRATGVIGSARERAMQEVRRAEKFLDHTNRLHHLNDNWVVSRHEGEDEGRIWRFECVWPGQYRERLFRNVQRVVLMSATLRPKTMGLLGIKMSECDFREWGRQFPAANGPVVWVPTCRMNHRTSEEDNAKWIERIREICSWGSDRKGIIHTVSYKRAKAVGESLNGGSRTNSHRGFERVYLNGAADPDSAGAREVYERFVSAESGVLVSPSFSTGWDFPGQSAEWQIISKIAFPDTRSKVMQARTSNDRSYGNYLAAQDLVQGCGRIVRSETDRGMTLCIDDNWSWFQRAASDHIPKWFKIRREEQLPKPLPKIL